MIQNSLPTKIEPPLRPSRTQPQPRHLQSARARSREPATPLTQRRRSTLRRTPAATHRHERPFFCLAKKTKVSQERVSLIFFLILFLAFCCLTSLFSVYSFFFFLLPFLCIITKPSMSALIFVCFIVFGIFWL